MSSSFRSRKRSIVDGRSPPATEIFYTEFVDSPAWLANLVVRLAPLMQITSRAAELEEGTLKTTFGLSAALTTKKGTRVEFSGCLTTTSDVGTGSLNMGGKKSWKKQKRDQMRGHA